MKVLLFFITCLSMDVIASRKILQGTKKEPIRAESAFLNNELFRPEYVPIYEQADLQQEDPPNQQLLQNTQVHHETDTAQPQTDNVYRQRELLLHHLKLLLASDPLLAAAILSQTLGVGTMGLNHGQNHPQHPLPNPYVSLLLSHYGRYLTPYHSPGRTGRGIYGYTAANNLHNNLPFGAYKLYKDVDV